MTPPMVTDAEAAEMAKDSAGRFFVADGHVLALLADRKRTLAAMQSMVDADWMVPDAIVDILKEAHRGS